MKKIQTVPRKIVLVDNDAQNAAIDKDALFTKGFEVVWYKSVAECDHDLSMLMRSADMFILDVLFDEEPEDHPCSQYPNSAAGIWLAANIRKKAADMPIILFSCDRSESIYPRAKRAASDMSTDSRSNCVFLKKNDYLPHKLSSLVQSYFARGKFEVSVADRANKLLDDAIKLIQRLKSGRHDDKS